MPKVFSMFCATSILMGSYVLAEHYFRRQTVSRQAKKGFKTPTTKS
jgi:hypothetical protein